MIFKNMQRLGVMSVERVIKVGDTVSDIREGRNAGVYTVGIVEGSSEMGLTKEEYDNMGDIERIARVEAVKERFLKAGADEVVLNMRSLMAIM